jgi:hypothetical protein
MEKLPWWSFWIPLLAVAWACNQKPEPAPELLAEQGEQLTEPADLPATPFPIPEPADVTPQLDPDVVSAIELGLIGAVDPGGLPIGTATVLPAGCEIWVVSKTKEWKLPPGVYRVELRTPDGPTEVGFMEDGAVEVHCYGLQSLRFGGANGIDRVLRLELAK